MVDSAHYRMFYPSFKDSLFICEKNASICTEQYGGSRALWTINGFHYIMKLLHALSVRKSLNIFCFLPQPGILHVPKLGLDRLTNVAVGCLIGNNVLIRPILTAQFSCSPAQPSLNKTRSQWDLNPGPLDSRSPVSSVILFFFLFFYFLQDGADQRMFACDLCDRQYINVRVFLLFGKSNIYD